MGPDDIFGSFHILFVRIGFPRIGGTSPHVAFRFELPCERLAPGGKCLCLRRGTVAYGCFGTALV